MEDLVNHHSANENQSLGATNTWNGRRVFLTGHTGFKGGWFALWLASNLSTGVTGETIYVDGGYSIVGW